MEPRMMRTGGRKRILLVACLVAIGAIITLALWNLWLGPYLTNGFPPGAAGFAMGGPATRVAPGSTGCRSLSENVCFSAWFETPFLSKTFSDLRLNIANASDPGGTPLPLGPGAAITVLARNHVTLAVWNVSDQSWSFGLSSAIPSNEEVPIVLDTGLGSTASLSNAELWGTLGGQGSGVALLPA